MKSGSLQLEKARTPVIHTQIILANYSLYYHCSLSVTINLHLRIILPPANQVLIKLKKLNNKFPLIKVVWSLGVPCVIGISVI